MSDCACSPLQNTVKSYHQHFLVSSSRQDWKEDVEKEDGFRGQMARDMKEYKKCAPLFNKFCLTDLPSSSPDKVDVYVFPAAVRYQNVGKKEWQQILKTHAQKGQVCSEVPSVKLEGKYIFVCTHGKRDHRCGEQGPVIMKKFQEEALERGLQDIHVHAISHIGGHKYAGNIIIYPEGDWYGYVTPESVPRIFDKHILGGETIEELHRGRMEAF